MSHAMYSARDSFPPTNQGSGVRYDGRATFPHEPRCEYTCTL